MATVPRTVRSRPMPRSRSLDGCGAARVARAHQPALRCTWPTARRPPFAVRTALGIATLALVVATVHLPSVTHDKLLGAVFGGFFLGAGIGLAVRGGGVIDGTEVLAIAVSRKLHHRGRRDHGDHVVIFGIAASVLSVETALYLDAHLPRGEQDDGFRHRGIEEFTWASPSSARTTMELRDDAEKLQRG